MKLEIEDIGLFKAIFRGITRFTDEANFDVTENGIRIRSIDPHDFCYVDIKLFPSFFKEFSWHNEKLSASAQINRFRSILPNITKDKPLFFEIRNRGISLNFVDGTESKYSLDWNSDNAYELPEPLKLKYELNITIPSNEFFEVIREASGVSREICFEIQGKKLHVTSSDQGFSYTKEIKIDNKSFGLSNKTNERSWVIIDYLRTLSEVITMCDEVKIGIKEDLPLRLDLSYKGRGKFIFIIANRKLTETQEKERFRHERKLANPLHAKSHLPHISVTKFPKFIKSIDAEDGVSYEDLKIMKYETPDRAYTRLAELIGFVIKKGTKYYLTVDGKDFVKSFARGARSLKPKLNKHLIKTVPDYSHILQYLSHNPMTPEDIQEKILSKSIKDSIVSSKDDVLLLLGIATWCNAVERKLGLYYFEKNTSN